MLIDINANTRITSDAYNIIVQKRHKVTRKTGEIEYEWRDKTFHPTIEQAVTHILDMRIRKSDAQSLVELTQTINEAKTELIEAVAKGCPK